MLIQLKGGCERTEVFISPKNYKSLKSKSDLKKFWFVECRFYDPRFEEKYPKGFPYRIKFSSSGSTLPEMKRTAEIYKEEMEHSLDNAHYNPITKTFYNVSSNHLSPDLHLIPALNAVREKLSVSEHHSKQLRCCINRIEKILPILRYEYMPVSEFKIWHIKNILDELKLTNSVYNKFRAYLKRMFRELIEYGCVFHNPCTDISKRMEVVKVREVLSDEKFKVVHNYLEENHYNFFRYAKIFFYSGGRSSELLRVQKKHCNLEKQEYQVLIKKGKTYTWETKIIIPQALPYWREILNLCKSDEDYLFTKCQLPSEKPIRPTAITRQWSRLVKNGEIYDINGNRVVVTEDFYALKHLFLDKLDKISNETPVIDINFAQQMANHRSNRTTGIYAVGRKQRANEILKQIKIL